MHKVNYRIRKHLSLPSILGLIRRQFNKVKETPSARAHIPLAECLMSGLAMFLLKYESLLAFDQEHWETMIQHNLATLYGVTHPPCDTYFRERLDVVNPEQLRRTFKAIFSL